MSMPAKILTVILLILSAAYAAVSTALFAKRQDYRTKWEQTRIALENLQTKYKQDVTRLENEKKDIDQKRRVAELRAQQLDSDLKKALAINKGLETEKFRFQDQIARLTDQTDRLTRELAESRKEVRLYRSNVDKLNQEIERCRAEIRDKQQQIEKLTTERNNLQVQVAELKKTLNQKEQDLNVAMRTLADLEKRGIEINPITTKPIDGKVLQADKTTHVVVIDKGRRDGVLVGSEFTVYSVKRGGYIGRIRIQDVREDLATGVPIREHTVKEIQVGDNVTNRIRTY